MKYKLPVHLELELLRSKHGNLIELTISEYSLLHWKSLFVIPTSDSEYISLPLITQRICFHFCPHSFLIEHTEDMLIVDFKDLLCPRWRNGHVQLRNNLQSFVTKLKSEILLNLTNIPSFSFEISNQVNSDETTGLPVQNLISLRASLTLILHKQ